MGRGARDLMRGKGVRRGGEAKYIRRPGWWLRWEIVMPTELKRHQKAHCIELTNAHGMQMHDLRSTQWMNLQTSYPCKPEMPCASGQL